MPSTSPSSLIMKRTSRSFNALITSDTSTAAVRTNGDQKISRPRRSAKQKSLVITHYTSLRANQGNTRANELSFFHHIQFIYYIYFECPLDASPTLALTSWIRQSRFVLVPRKRRSDNFHDLISFLRVQVNGPSTLRCKGFGQRSRTTSLFFFYTRVGLLLLVVAVVVVHIEYVIQKRKPRTIRTETPKKRFHMPGNTESPAERPFFPTNKIQI